MKPDSRSGKIALGLLLLGLLLLGLHHSRTHFIDYPVYQLAGDRVLRGHEAALYDRYRTTPGGFYYSYFFAFAFAPLALYPVKGKILFLLILFAAFLKTLRFSVPRESPYPYGIAIALCGLSLYALNDAFMNANIGVILLAMCLMAYEQAEKRPWLAGIFLGCAITFKVYPLLVLCYFIWAKQFKVVAWSMLTVAATFVGLPIVVYGVSRGNQLLQDQVYVLSHFGSHWRYDSLVFQNIPATTMRYWELLGGNPDRAFLPAVAGALLGMLLFYLKSFLERGELGPEFKRAMFFLVLAAIPLIGPVTWYNMALFYLPILGHYVGDLFSFRRTSSWVALVSFAVLFCLTTPDILGRPINDKFEYFGIPFFGALTLVGTYLREVRHRFPGHFFLPTARA